MRKTEKNQRETAEKIVQCGKVRVCVRVVSTHEYAGDVGEYAGEVGLYAGLVGLRTNAISQIEEKNGVSGKTESRERMQTMKQEKTAKNQRTIMRSER